SMSDKSERSVPFGAGHMQAMGRLGLAELRAAVSFEGSNIVQPTERGLYGTALQSEVKDQREAEALGPSEPQPSGVQERLKQAEQGAARARDGREPPARDLERE